MVTMHCAFKIIKNGCGYCINNISIVVLRQEHFLYKEKDMLHIMMNKDNMKESGKERCV